MTEKAWIYSVATLLIYANKYNCVIVNQKLMEAGGQPVMNAKSITVNGFNKKKLI